MKARTKQWMHHLQECWTCNAEEDPWQAPLPLDVLQQVAAWLAEWDTLSPEAEEPHVVISRSGEVRASWRKNGRAFTLYADGVSLDGLRAWGHGFAEMDEHEAITPTLGAQLVQWVYETTESPLLRERYHG